MSKSKSDFEDTIAKELARRDKVVEKTFKSIVRIRDKLVLIDTSNLSYAIYYVAQQNGEYNPQIAYYILRSKIRKIKALCNTKRVVYVLDAGRGNKEKLLSNSYKANRPVEVDNPVGKALKILRKLVKTESDFAEDVFVYAKNEEADDCIASIIKQKQKPTIIITSDQDIWQLISVKKKVMVVKTTTFELANFSALYKKYGITNFKGLVTYKCIFGDPSDNIRPIFNLIYKRDVLPLINRKVKLPEVAYVLNNKYKHDCLDELQKRSKAIKLRTKLFVRQIVRLKKLKIFIKYKEK